MATALTDYFDKDHFHALVQEWQAEYGNKLEGMSEIHKLLLVCHLAMVSISKAASRTAPYAQAVGASTLIEFLSSNLPCELFLFTGEQDKEDQPYRLVELANRLGEVSDRRQRLQMIAALADLLLKEEAKAQ